MELDELRDAMEELSYDDVEFFAHLTERDKESSIFEKGLYIDDNKISSCANKVTDSFYEDPEHFIDYELGSPQTRGKEIMILIASQKDDERSLIERNDDEESEYVIHPQNIIGSVDLDTKYFDPNPNSEYSVGIGQIL